jgi:SPP1 gp7 family putative phage head morphogenesis protein
MPAKQNDWSRLPFSEAVAFFRQKQILPTRSWQDVQRGAHDKAFVVAGLANRAALEEFRAAIERQLASGMSYKEFQKDFDRIVAKYGWEHKGTPAWRARTIFETNIRTAYAAGRWAQLQDPDVAKALPYIQYKHSGAEHFRPLHKAWDGLVLLRTDKFWQTNLPPNGFGCKCQFFPLSAGSLKRLGKDGPDRNPYDVIAENGGEATRRAVWTSTGEIVDLPRGVDLGWDYLPGQSWLRGVTPIQGRAAPFVRPAGSLASDGMPAPRSFASSGLLDPGTVSAAEAVSRFLESFGASPAAPLVFYDVLGEPLLINDLLFRNKATDEFKLTANRIRTILMLAETIRNPDEIYRLFEPSRDGGPDRLKQRYIAQWLLEGSSTPAYVAFDWSRDVWSGSTAFPPKTESYLLRQRVGTRVYRRGS